MSPHALLLSLSLLALPSLEESGAFRDLDFDEARAAAAREGKVVMIDFFTTWCGPCKQLDGFTWPEPEVQEWLLENTVPIKLDAEKEVRTASLYEVNVYPSIVFTTPEGLELDRLAGAVDARKFVGAARAILAAQGNADELSARIAGAGADDPHARFAYANLLAGRKQFRPAAEQYRWCLEEGARHADFQEIRRGTFLAQYAHFSKTWPQAKRAMQQWRDAAAGRLGEEAIELDDALDVAALDVALGQQTKTLKLYDDLAERGAEAQAARRALLPVIFEQLASPRRYGDVMRCEPDFGALLDEELARLAARAARWKDEPRAAHFLDSLRSAAVTRGALYVEVLTAAGEDEGARELGERLCELDPTPRTFLALARRTKRTQDLEAALFWARRGMETVPEDSRASLKAMTQGLERELAAKR